MSYEIDIAKNGYILRDYTDPNTPDYQSNCWVYKDFNQLLEHLSGKEETRKDQPETQELVREETGRPVGSLRG